MSCVVQQMSADEFAQCQMAVGERVEKHGAIWWLRTKRVFLRPLLPYQPYSIPDQDLPPFGLGGLQYTVADPQDANATMGFLMLEDLQSYQLEDLSHNRRRLIKNAAKNFVIRPIANGREFKEDGFHAYSSFYRRTRYEYKSERTDRANYSRWADAVLQSPKAYILGGYERNGALKAVSISYWVGETLIYSTFFSETSSLKKGIGELMFHALRENVSNLPGIGNVYVRRYQGGNGMDSYYLMRGAKLVVRPSKVRLHPVTRWILKVCFPDRYLALSTELKGLEVRAELGA